jgi:ubiquinone/menaquinone biosynthesis C-methylase UbiE
MSESSAYLLSEVDVSGQEVRRLSAQAQLFIELELPFLLAEIPPQARVADFGCGSGDIVKALAKARPQADVWGFDADPLAVGQSQEQLGPLRNLQIQRYAMGQGSPCPAQALDLAFTRFVLLHVPDPVAALKDMAAALNTAGKLYVVEADDSEMRFHPAEPWQDRLLELFEKVQASRGGSRRRGAVMGNLMKQAGLRALPLATVHYCKSRIGAAAFAELFMPVVAFYLGAAIAFAPAQECQDLLAKTRAFIEDPANEIDMALFHWVSTGNYRDL